MQIRVERGELKRTKSDKDYTNLQGSDGNWYNVMGDLTGLMGRTVEIDPQPFGKGMWAQSYIIIQADEPIPQPEPAQAVSRPTPTGQGYAPPVKIGFWEAVGAVKTLHNQFANRESDPQARAAMINTMMIAITSGKVEMPPEGPFSEEEDNVPDFASPSLNPLPMDGKVPF